MGRKESSHGRRVPRFIGTGTPFRIALNGIRGGVFQYPVSRAVTSALSDMTVPHWLLYGATFRMDPGELVSQIRDATAFQRFIYSVLFHADAPPPYGEGRLSWGGSGDPGPNMRVESVTRADALKRAYDALCAPVAKAAPAAAPGVAEVPSVPVPMPGQASVPLTVPGPVPLPVPVPVEDQTTPLIHAIDDSVRMQRLTNALSLALSSMFQGRGFAPWYAHWDNSEDTTLEGILGIHAESGEVRVIALWHRSNP